MKFSFSVSIGENQIFNKQFPKKFPDNYFFKKKMEHSMFQESNSGINVPGSTLRNVPYSRKEFNRKIIQQIFNYEFT